MQNKAKALNSAALGFVPAHKWARPPHQSGLASRLPQLASELPGGCPVPAMLVWALDFPWLSWHLLPLCCASAACVVAKHLHRRPAPRDLLGEVIPDPRGVWPTSVPTARAAAGPSLCLLLASSAKSSHLHGPPASAEVSGCPGAPTTAVTRAQHQAPRFSHPIHG